MDGTDGGESLEFRVGSILGTGGLSIHRKHASLAICSVFGPLDSVPTAPIEAGWLGGLVGPCRVGVGLRREGNGATQR